MIKTLSYSSLAVVRYREEYNGDPLQKSHLNKKVIADLFHLITKEESFTEKVERLWHRYHAWRGSRRGRKAKQMVSETFYRSPVGAFLSARERFVIFTRLCGRLAPNAPAIGFWHVHKDGSADLHILISNVTLDPVPRLRREAYGNGQPNFCRFLHESENLIIGDLNKERLARGEPMIPTMPTVRDIIALAKGFVPLPHRLFMLKTGVNAENLLELIWGLGCRAELEMGGAMVRVWFDEGKYGHRFNVARLIVEANAPPLLELLFLGYKVGKMDERDKLAQKNAAAIDAEVERIARISQLTKGADHGRIR